MNDNLMLPNADFLKEFVLHHKNTPQRPFCWILGSGTSRQSGIRMGREMTEQWLAELYNQSNEPSKPKSPIEEWARNEFSDVPNFDYRRAVNSYPYIYQRRYRDCPAEGYAFLEKEMENAQPSIGYTVLAQIMTGTNHRVAVTTNFDYLLSDSLAIYCNTLPFDCGHESLASYITLALRRPVIAKLHRDLMIAPTKDPKELAQLHHKWEIPLTKLFEHYTPIIIGFGDSGGSGGSLMSFFETLPTVPGGIYWCYREKQSGSQPDEEVQSLVKRHNGHFVPIMGFDEFMLQLWEKLWLTSLHNDLLEKYDKIAARYQAQFSGLTTAIISSRASNNTETVKSTIASAETVQGRLNADSLI